MDNINFNLIQVRVSAFFHELLSMAIVGFFGFLSSDTFQNLISKHFGATVVTSLILLGVNGAVKHFRNLKAVQAYTQELGSSDLSNRPSLPNLI